MKQVISRAIKYKEIYLLDPNDLLLISTNIKLKFDFKIEEIIKKNKKENDSFRIPVIFLKYTKNNKLKVKVCKDFKNLLEKDNYYIIDAELVREVGEKGFNYFL